METQEQEKSKKFNTKIYIDVGSIPNATDLISDVYKRVNTKKFGKNIGLGQIFVHCLKKLGNDDIEKIQDENLSTEDLLRKKHEEFVLKTGEKIDFYDFIVKNSRILKH